MTRSSLDAIRHRRFEPVVSRDTTEPVPRRRSAMSGLVLIVFLLVGGFFLVTKPATQTPKPSLPTATADSLGAPPAPRPIGPPEPNAGGSLEETIILDQPLAASVAQTAPTEPVAAESSGVALDSFTVRILNGSGESGSAAALQAALKGRGFNVVSIGSAINLYRQTVIYYQGDHRAAAATVQSVVGSDRIRLEASSIAAPADVLVVIGKER